LPKPVPYPGLKMPCWRFLLPERGSGIVQPEKDHRMRELTYTEALLEAFREEMRRDEKVFHLCGGLGALASLIPEFGEARVRVCRRGEPCIVEIDGAGGAGRRVGLAKAIALRVMVRRDAVDAMLGRAEGAGASRPAVGAAS